jgi:hypothetical protein
VSTVGATASSISPRYSVLASSIRGPDGTRTTDCRDVVGSIVLVCQIHMSCGLLGEVLVPTKSRAELLEVIPFFFRFRVLEVVPLAPRFDITEVRREYVSCYVSQISNTRTHRSRMGGFLDRPAGCTECAISIWNK